MISSIDPVKWNFEKLDLSQPRVMGILNLTPDSFYDGGRYNLADSAVQRAAQLLEEGASILDIGALSTRPNAKEVCEYEEWERLREILPLIRKEFPDILISVDTYRSGIAEKAVTEGADIINDISGGRFDNNMAAKIAEIKVPYIIMHIQGTPQTMQKNPKYENVLAGVDRFLKDQIAKLKSYGVDKNLILDPGFGFGKTVDHNFQLLHGIRKLKENGFPILAGLSRKSMINKVLGTKPENALNGTTALHMLALQNGADILRVHDVKPAVETVKLYLKYAENASRAKI